MARYRKIIPDGACDLLFKECEARRAVERSLIGLFKSRGFSEVVTPSLEFFDVFSGKAAVMNDEMMYKLIDGRGRILVLRPDNTMPIARIASTKLKNFAPPLRLYYNQNVFRVSPYMSGRYNEVAQCGVELIGVSGEKADIEVIVTAITALNSVVGGGFRFEIGHNGFYKAIIDELPYENEVKERIRSLIASKSYASLYGLLSGGCSPAFRALRELPRLFGGVEVLDRALVIAPNGAASDIAGYLKELYGVLCSMGLEKNIMIDLGLVQQIEYYSGVVFRGYIHGPGEPVLSGGRYDGLFSNFGLDWPAAGFAVNTDAIARTRAGKAESERPDVIIHYEKGYEKKAYERLESLAACGSVCEMSVFETAEQTREYAAARGIARMDVVAETVSTIDLAGGQALT